MTTFDFVALAIVLIVIAYLAVIYFAQRSLLFPAPIEQPPQAGRAEIVLLSVAGGEAQALLLVPATPSSGLAPLLIFMHGNRELADDWLSEFEEVTEWGMAVLLLEYPGYGRSSGRPSENSINAAAQAAYDWAQADPRIDAKRIVPYGRSLGGGVAARLAADRAVSALVLESSFTSVAAFASRFLVPRFMVRDRFDSAAALGTYRGPLLVIHGLHDSIVPIAQGRALAAAVPRARFHELSCGHNDCPRPWDLIRQFLRDNGVLAPE